MRYTREKMAEAAEEVIPLAEAYEETDRTEFRDLPAFEATHRRNGYDIHLSLEEETLEGD